MPMFKLTAFFASTNGNGWSESFYTNNYANMLNASTYWARYPAIRKPTMGIQTSLTYLRTSLVGPGRNVYVQAADGASGPVNGKPIGLTDNSDYSALAILIKCYSAGYQKSKNWFFRGSPDDASERGGTLSIAGGFDAQITAVQTFLRQGVCGWLSRGTTVYQPLAAPGVTVGQGNRILYTFAGAPFAAIAVNTVVTMSFNQIIGATAANGTQTVQILSGNTCQTVAPLAILPYLGGGQGRLISTAFSLIPIQFLQPERIVERRAGRPSYVSAGRRRGRRKA